MITRILTNFRYLVSLINVWHFSDHVGHYNDPIDHLLDSNYRLVHILRGPSKLAQVQKDGSRDTDIWAAEFEPAIDNGEQSQRTS
jgi:hypothetical protein